MSEITILVLEDEPEVRAAVVRDLELFTSTFHIEASDEADDARAVIGEVREAGGEVGLILCDHLLPGLRGTDFLIELNNDPATASMRKVLLTGQAGHEDTIRAINDGGLDHYITKPWTVDELHAVVKEQLTEYVLTEIDDLLPYVNTLDGPRLLEAISERGWDR
ncbi:MAG: response regulator [Acidimicrobiia bacterium]|nr:response regulator [Acidimicrobiia bacterium]